jgi:hypothetical protein
MDNNSSSIGHTQTQQSLSNMIRCKIAKVQKELPANSLGLSMFITDLNTWRRTNMSNA